MAQSGTSGSRREFIDAYPIPVPPLPEQQRIVGIPDEAFDGIATAKANAEKNLQNACALFESHRRFHEQHNGWGNNAGRVKTPRMQSSTA